MRFLFPILILVSTAVYSQHDTSFHSYQQKMPLSNYHFSMAAIPGGYFQFGSDKAGNDADEKPSHKVFIDAFWMGAKEVTYEEFNEFFDDQSESQNTLTDAITRPSSPYIDMTLAMGKAGGFPANSMQQFGALMYCKWLYKKTGIFYRLPTEAEWEYACKAGNTGTNTLTDEAWFASNSNGVYHATGLKKPNAFGLYDMLGNVSEWVLDQYQDNFYSTLSDTSRNPIRIPEKKNPRLVKGGNYLDGAMDMRAANRTMADPVWNRRDPQIPKSKWWNADAPFVGFRIVRPVKQPSPDEVDFFYNLYLGF